MRELTVTAWGLVAVFAGRWFGGFGWPSAAFLFFPAFGIVSGVLNNEGRRIVKNAILFVGLWIGLAAVPQISLRICSSLPKNVALDGTGRFVMSVLVSAAFWAVLSCVAELPSRMLGNWTVPGRLHGPLVKLLVIAAYSLTLLALVTGIRVVSEHVVHIPPAAKLALTLGLVVIFAIAIRRVLTRGIETPVAATGGTSGTGGVRLSERPTTTFADVEGMDEVKDQIRLRLIEPVRNAARAKKYGLKVGGGMLLYGPPGTGKTLLARAVAGELGLPFYVITAADVFGKYVGESERNIRKIFADVRKNKLSVVFVDELETLFPNRSNDVHETTRKVISVLLQELDGIDQGKNPMLLIGATNVPWMVDEAFMRPGRFDVKTFVGLPDFAARRGMLVRAFAQGSVPHEAGLTAYMAESTPNYSGADLNGVMNRLRQMAYDRHVSRYTRALADEAIAGTSPTANGETMDRIRDWEAENMPENSSNAGSAGMRLAVYPETTLDDVAGMSDVKEQIRMRLVEPVQHQTLANLYGLKAGGGILLYGPPGTGKTFLARAVAGELKLPFYCITAADIFGRFVGESERNVRRIFREVRKNALSVVFIDELESIVPKRTEQADDSTRKVISVLLQELDGLDQGKNPILLIGATNVPWMVDDAFLRPGRFDVKVYVGLPDYDARRQMFINHLYSCKVPHEDGLTGHLAQRTEGFTGADINGVWERMRQIGYRRKIETFDYKLADEVLDVVHPTSSSEMIRKIREWESSRGS